VDKAESEKELAFKINAEAPSLLADMAAKHGCRYIHISTDFVFDGTASQPITEDAATNPLSVYGASKLQGDLDVHGEEQGCFNSENQLGVFFVWEQFCENNS
jgi:dTDP-4-dehydrorhamnose reductase